ncbi:MAG: ABC transporter substrate-binding protein [Dehalococcoidia bacterium]
MLKGAAGAGLGGLALWLAACQGSDDDEGTSGSGSPAQSAAGTSSPATATAAQLEQFEWTQNKPDLKAAARRGGTFKYSTHVTPPSLDPIKSASFESANIYTPAYNRLIRGEYGTELEPYNPWRLRLKGDLAESWEHPDAMTYVLKLRPNVNYQDVPPVSGRPFTAADAKFSLDAFLASAETASQLPFRVEAPDAQSVKLTLTKPANYVLQALGDPRFVMLAREVAEEDGDFSKRAVGTGPFILDEMVPSTRARYRRNPTYFRQDRPYLDALQFDHFKDSASSKAAFIANQYEYAQYLTTLQDEVNDVLAARKDAVSLKLQSRWQSNVFSIGFAADRPPYSDVRVRTAISKGFDHGAHGEKAYPLGYNVLGAYAWIDMFESAPDLGDAYKYDPQAAKQMLTAAGVQTPLTVPLDYFVYGGDAEDQLQLIQEQLKGIDVDLQLQKLDYTAFLAKYYGQKVDNAITSFIPTTPRWAPLSMFSLFRSGQPKNYLRISSPEFDVAVDKLTTTESTEEQKKAYQEAWLKLMQPAYFVSMSEGSTFFISSPKLHGLLPNMYNDPAGWGNQAMEDWWVET